MSFWKRFAAVAKVVAPAVLSVIPGVPAVLIPLIVHGITEAEGIPGATGAQKKDHVLAIVKDGLTVTNATGKVVIPTADVLTAVNGGIDAAVTAVNAVKESHAVADVAAPEKEEGGS